jgi:hypothetical protein
VSVLTKGVFFYWNGFWWQSYPVKVWDGSAWVIADDDDVDSGGPTVQTITGTSAGDTATGTFSGAFASGNHALSIYFTENSTGASAQASWTQLANPTIGGLLSFAMGYRLSDAVTTAVGTFTPSGATTRVLGAEVAAASASGPVVTDEPDNATAIVTPSSPAVFTAVATTDGASLAQQWYRGASGTTTNPINTGGVYVTGASGTTTRTLTLTITPTDTSLNAETYWVRITDSAGSTDSTAATLTVLAGDTLTQPVGTTNSSGNPATSSGSLVSNAPGLTRLVATVGGVALDQIVVITKR